ncbi:hypothetical protein [Burkholderia lata]|uniref:hypothetical protein n=1 Tax=Burkholderia lata (strain ATCC 17760 / DSM 23089 / LMG 22485 / NCIMB 9086 / R18194 / 383) TaxID=482957 RepID=UPI0039996089
MTPGSAAWHRLPPALFAQARSQGCSKRESFRYRHGTMIDRRDMRCLRAFDRPAGSKGKYVEFSRTGKHIV